MDQRKAQNKSPMFEKGLEEENLQIEGHPRKTLRKAMQKMERKWKGKKMPINSKRGKTIFN